MQTGKKIFVTETRQAKRQEPASEKVLAMKGNPGLDLAQIQRKLGQLQKHADKKKLPYANMTARKWFRPNPPLAEADVRRFESEHRVRLPEDHREFLLKVGKDPRQNKLPLLR